MNKFKLHLERILKEEILSIDGLDFSNALLVRVLIDDIPISKFKSLEDALVVFPELLKSLSESGLYLIFTSASGIADDGGWEGVAVSHKNGIINWDFEVENENYHFEFDKNQYKRTIKEMEMEIETTNSTSDLELEPVGVFFPESWDEC